MSLAYYGEP